MRQSDSVSPSGSATPSDTVTPLDTVSPSDGVTPSDSGNPSESIGPVEAVVGPPPKKTGFRDDIEGLRGFTLLAIVGWHISMPGVSGGFVGPDIFFEISGFVITGALWKQLSSTGTL